MYAFTCECLKNNFTVILKNLALQCYYLLMNQVILKIMSNQYMSKA